MPTVPRAIYVLKSANANNIMPSMLKTQSYLSFLDPGHCQDSIKYASKCPGWTWACSDTRCAAFMLTNCKKTCGYCGSVELLPVIPLYNSTKIYEFGKPSKRCPIA